MLENSLAFGQDPIWDIMIRFWINLVVLFILIRGIFYKYSGDKNYLFSFHLMGIIIFLMCILLKNVEISLGIGFGLFALFSILRFRTRNISTKIMTYYLTVIGISAINALAVFYNPVRGPLVINLMIILSVLLLEIFTHKKKSGYRSHVIMYNNLDLLNPDLMPELLTDISNRIGKKIEKVEIRKIDLIKGNAELDVFFKAKAKKDN